MYKLFTTLLVLTLSLTALDGFAAGKKSKQKNSPKDTISKTHKKHKKTVRSKRQLKKKKPVRNGQDSESIDS